MEEHIIDIGNTVLCDYCNRDFTESDETGDLLVGAEAVCPRCEPQVRERLKMYGEEGDIAAECPAGMSFWKFVLAIRNGDNTIRIRFWDA
jgi:hypothetical protein